jgi:uncharacterized coiled-coil protein SlyX
VITQRPTGDAELAAARARIGELKARSAARAENIKALTAIVVELSLLLDQDTNVRPILHAQ